MLAEDRFAEILKILEEQRSVTVLELTECLNTSESTIRRDLTELHKLGLLTKVHGGAVINTITYTTKDSDLATRQEINRSEKVRIAKYCASRIEENDFVFLDAGTTTELIADYITAANVVFVTNGLNNARRLAARGYKVILLGGILKLTTDAVVGSETLECLAKYNFSKGFFGTNGVSLTSGYTTPEPDEAMVKKIALSKCKDKYIACDSSKFNQISSITFADFDSVRVITGKLDDASYKEYTNIVEVENL